MSYNKALVSSKQKAMIKSITDLLNVLSEIEIGGTGGNNGEITLDDGSVMTLSTTADKGNDLLNIKKISVTNATLNLDITISRDSSKIRLVKAKPASDETIHLVPKKKHK
jgi:hypothetical protein